MLAAIDQLNAGDPNRIVYRGELVAKEPLHAELMTRWLERLAPDPHDLQRIAARGHHVQRWRRPRGDYPEGRKGYLRWRTDAKKFHAEVVTELMAHEGYGDDEMSRTARVIRKEGLGRDEWVQVHEDALCLVFLETQLESTAARLGDDEMVAVLERTIPKMSVEGVAAAGELELGPLGAELLGRALGGVDSAGLATVREGQAPQSEGGR